MTHGDEGSLIPPDRAVFRFAPSPNGRLHLGHAYSALINQRLADRLDGHVLLRLENIDRDRCTPALEAAIVEDLAWIGFRWQVPALRQSDRSAAYEAMLGRLGDVTYPCFCTRGDIARATARRPDWPRDPDGVPLYPGTCRKLSTLERSRREAVGPPPALRLDMAAALASCPGPIGWTERDADLVPQRVVADPAAWGDVLIARRDVPASYHLAVVTDDAFQAVTHVVRGRDLFHATSLHRLLQGILGLPEPDYHHHDLVRDAAGCKLSKSRNAESLHDLRMRGVTPASLRRDLGL